MSEWQDEPERDIFGIVKQPQQKQSQSEGYAVLLIVGTAALVALTVLSQVVRVL
jgi:hypothetical protein